MNKHIDGKEMAVMKKNRMYGLMSSTGNREVQNVRHDITHNLLQKEVKKILKQVIYILTRKWNNTEYANYSRQRIRGYMSMTNMSNM